MADEFKNAGAALIADLAVELEKGAAEIMGVADTLVPKDTETLRESARIFAPEYDGVTLKVTFGFGFGGAINLKTGNPVDTYTVPVHEILEAFHEPPTQAKFLETPLFAYAGAMEGRLDAELRIAWGRRLASGNFRATPFPLFGGGYTMRDLEGRFAAP